MRAESPGPAPGKLVPRIGESSKILYIIYAVMTAAVIILLTIAGMPVFNSFIYAFGTAGTGGFAMDTLSVGAYNNPWIEWIITISMFLFGVNFSLYFLLLKKDFKNIFKNEELRLYIIYVLLGIVLVVINVLPKFNNNLWETIRHSAFTVSSLVTTTGYATVDFNLWPMFSKSILLTLMFFGACAGSTGGGVKAVRILVMIKSFFYEIKHTIHPKSVQRIKVDGKSLEDDNLKSIMIFIFAYVFIIIISAIVVSLDNFDFMTSFSAVLATISNIGPGFEVVGPMGSYADFSLLSKVVLISNMILGRLEIIPVIILFTPEIWRKH
jgi:trk system potassium uptake protein TrkH